MTWVLTTALSVCIGLLGCIVACWIIQWHTRQLKAVTPTQTTVSSDIAGATPPMHLSTMSDVDTLNQRINDIQIAMSGVVQGLQAMNNQVQHVSQMTHTMAHHLSQGQPEQSPLAQMMIALKGRSESQRSGKTISIDELPPEVAEKLRVFQAIHVALLDQDQWPSRQRPELN
jgi:uncharacterized phage infection (PIP) family protein YhgE